MKNLRLMFYTVLSMVAMAATHAVEAKDLRTKYLTNPLGIDAAKPWLNWVIEA